MKRIFILLCLTSMFAACSTDPYDPFVPDSPIEVKEIKARAGIRDDEFCRHVDLENIHKTIPVVNRYIDNLPQGLDNRQVAQALVALFRSFDGITDARLFQDEYMRTPAVFFSFMDGETARELALDFSSTGKVLSYHYNVVIGAYVSINKGVSIERVFDMINSLDLKVEEIMYGTYISNAPSSETELQRILDGLNAKAYTNEGDNWKTNGYLHYQTGQITVFPHLIEMHNRDYQADWLASIRQFSLIESFDGIGYAVEFVIPEDKTIPESHWRDMFAPFDIVEVAYMNYNRYTLADESIEEGYEEGVAAVDSKIHIQPVEIYKTSPRTFQLHCTTERQYSSGSNPIRFVKQQTDGTIDISFKGVAEIGMTADIGPARAYIDLGPLAEGTYALNLHNGSVVQRGTLIVTKESFTVEMADNDTFGFVVNTLNRIPENTIWGYVGLSVAESFIADLIGIGASEKSYIPGFYREFEIDENGNVVQPKEPYENIPVSDKYFVLHYPGDLAQIGQLVERYWHEYENYIMVYTEQGQEFRSWMYDRE
jgi:hypothetical protein